MKYTKLKGILLAAVVAMQWSCSVNESVTLTEEEANLFSSEIKNSDFKEVIMDGKVINDQDVIDEKIRSSHSVHYDYGNKKIVISTNEAEFQKYINSSAELRNAFAKMEQERLNGTSASSETEKNLNWNMANYHQNLVFHYLRESSYGYERHYAFKAITANDMRNVRVPQHVVRNGDSSPYTINSPMYFSHAKVGSSRQTLHLRNAGDGWGYLFYYTGLNYTGSYKFVSVPPNSDIILSESVVRPNGSDVANSVYVYDF
jgi:hypothetical protein